MTRTELEALLSALAKFEATAPKQLKVSYSDALDHVASQVRHRLEMTV